MTALAKKSPAKPAPKEEKSSRKDKQAAPSSLARQLLRRADKVKLTPPRPGHLSVVPTAEK